MKFDGHTLLETKNNIDNLKGVNIPGHFASLARSEVVLYTGIAALILPESWLCCTRILGGLLLSKIKNERIIVATCFKEDSGSSYKEVWDKIMRDTIEKKYGKIK